MNKNLVMILVLGMLCFSFVSADLRTKIDFEISGFEGIDSLDNSDGESVVISIYNDSGLVVSRNATAGIYLPNMTLTMSGEKFNLSYSTKYTYNLSTKYGDFLYNFTTPKKVVSIVDSWNDSKDYFVGGNTEGNGTVLDTQNNLMWQDGKSDTALFYNSTYSGGSDGAMEYCDNLVWGGYNDWRLPNVGEFISLIKYSYGGLFFPSAFSNDDVGGYWTSTINKDFDSAYVVGMGPGGVFYDHVGGGGYYARCVRPEMGDLII